MPDQNEPDSKTLPIRSPTNKKHFLPELKLALNKLKALKQKRMNEMDNS